MRRCSWHKGCWLDAYGDEKWCYWHSKKREPLTEAPTRDLNSTEAWEIRRAERLLHNSREGIARPKS